jgi:shikimate dehydrogenase
MELIDDSKKTFGLIGRDISYSFSKGYFTEKFLNLGLDNYRYENIEIDDISQFKEAISKIPDLRGLNVTIPYKETVIPLLDKLSGKASKIGAVNTIRLTKKGKLKGYNTDCYGFKKSLEPLLESQHRKALILGTGGASKAVAFALMELGILYTIVSREELPGMIDYNRINATTFDNHQIVVNCTPLGTYPNVVECPPLPYEYFTSKHIAFDLVYNPSETEFLKRAKHYEAVTKNGYEMLVLQAEKAWRIWNKY